MNVFHLVFQILITILSTFVNSTIFKLYLLINKWNNGKNIPNELNFYSIIIQLSISFKYFNTPLDFKDHGNRMLLFHGSRMSNYAGILSQGLRIAPPEAPVTGYMFGKGCYFADMSSKSANYCWADRSNPKALLLLCEVSLGKR